MDFETDKNGKLTQYNGTEINVTIPQEIEGIQITAIGSRAFASKGLTSVVLPEGVIKIGTWAFWGNCLTEIIIPARVTDIGIYAFLQNQISKLVIFGKVKITDLSFDNGFDVFYRNNKKKAGTYLFDGTNWEYKK